MSNLNSPNTENLDIENLNICDLISQLESIGSEKDKNEFLKNYSDLKNKIISVDKILSQSNTEDITNMTIPQLFELLDKYNHKIENPNFLNIQDLNIISNLVKLLEEKISQEKINLVEIK